MWSPSWGSFRCSHLESFEEQGPGFVGAINHREQGLVTHEYRRTSRGRRRRDTLDYVFLARPSKAMEKFPEQSRWVPDSCRGTKVTPRNRLKIDINYRAAREIYQNFFPSFLYALHCQPSVSFFTWYYPLYAEFVSRSSRKSNVSDRLTVPR